LACACAALALAGCATGQPQPGEEVHVQRYPGIVSGVYRHPAADAWRDAAPAARAASPASSTGAGQPQ
jgi:hypothetical protein